MKRKKRTADILAVFIFAVTFCCIIVGFAFYEKYVEQYNFTEKTEYATHEKEDLVSIYHRGNVTDSWVKYIYKERNGTTTYVGNIFEAQINNITPYKISDWKMRINIHNDCFLNNGWSGTFEIHQFHEGKEMVQTLDLRDYNRNDIQLSYMMSNKDLLIPLQEGDYIIYFPNEEVKEKRVESSVQTPTASVVKIGIIFYTASGVKMGLDDVTLYYMQERSIWQGSGIIILYVSFILWLSIVMMYCSYRFSTRQNRKIMERKDRIIQESITVFTSFFDAKDPYTNGHSQRVAEYAKMIAEKLSFSEEECKIAYYIALMHDCGKCYIPDSILKKPGRLTEVEYQSIVNHTIYGSEMLKDFSSIKGIADGALYHHERYDGQGYPFGKKGEEIPLIGRIICVADAFDAMNSRRCYRNELSKEYIINELILNKGHQFDPKVVDCMLQLIEEQRIIFGAEGI